MDKGEQIMVMKEHYIDLLKDTEREIEYCKSQLKKNDGHEDYWFIQISYYQGRKEVIKETLEWLD